MKSFIKSATIAGTIWLIMMLVLFPKICIDAGLFGVFLCLDTVIPSLFPFFVCSGLIIGLGVIKPIQKLFTPFMKQMFKISGSGVLPFILGILSGYGVGAKCVADLYSGGYCTKKEGEKLLAFCNNSGPLFILGAVGVGMAGSVQVGRFLYIIHILSAIITGIIFRFYDGGEVEQPCFPIVRQEGFLKTVANSFSSATESIISVCGFVILFSVASAALPKLGITPFIHGFLEITGGVEEILTLPAKMNVKLPVISAVIAFSGLSVMLQVGTIIGKTDLSPKLYIIGKIVQGVIAYILTVFALKFI